MEKKFRVVVGDPFGGYVCIKSDLSEEEADALVEKETQDVDYFTTVQKVENDNVVYRHLVPIE